GNLYAEMTSMALEQHLRAKRRHENRFGFQLIQGTTRKVPIIGGDGDVHVAAELGGAVQNARLTSHEQSADPMFPESRKDFANRARGQGNLPRPGRWPTASAIPRTAAPASATTIRAFPDLLEARR